MRVSAWTWPSPGPAFWGPGPLSAVSSLEWPWAGMGADLRGLMCDSEWLTVP